MTADDKIPENVSLDDYLKGIEADKARMEDIAKARAGLESSVALAYEKVKPELKKLNGKDAFGIYQETGSIDERLLDEYLKAVEQFSEQPYKVHSLDGLAKRAVKYLGETGLQGPALFIGLFLGLPASCMGGLFFLKEGWVQDSIIATIIGGGSSLAGFGLGGLSIVGREIQLKGKAYKFKEGVNDFIEKTYRLNYLAQRMLEETQDIKTLDGLQVEWYVSKYGVEGIRNRMKTTREHLANVQDCTSQILSTAGVPVPDAKNYKPLSAGKEESYEAEYDLDARLRNLERQRAGLEVISGRKGRE